MFQYESIMDSQIHFQFFSNFCRILNVYLENVCFSIFTNTFKRYFYSLTLFQSLYFQFTTPVISRIFKLLQVSDGRNTNDKF